MGEGGIVAEVVQHIKVNVMSVSMTILGQFTLEKQGGMDILEGWNTKMG